MVDGVINKLIDAIDIQTKINDKNTDKLVSVESQLAELKTLIINLVELIEVGDKNEDVIAEQCKLFTEIINKQFTLGFLDIPIPSDNITRTDRGCWGVYLAHKISEALDIATKKKELLGNAIFKKAYVYIATRYTNQRGEMENGILQPYLEEKLVAQEIDLENLSEAKVNDNNLGKYEKLINAAFDYVSVSWNKTSKLKKNEEPSKDQALFFFKRIVLWAINRRAIGFVDFDENLSDTETVETESQSTQPLEPPASSAPLMDKAMFLFGTTVKPQNFKGKGKGKARNTGLTTPKEAKATSEWRKKKLARAKELSALNKYSKPQIIEIVNKEFPRF